MTGTEGSCNLQIFPPGMSSLCWLKHKNYKKHKASAKFMKAVLLECLVWQTERFLNLFLVIFNFSFISVVSLKEARVPSRTIRAICNEPPQWNKQSERWLAL